MGDIFIGTEAVTGGAVTRHELARWHRPIFPNVYAPKGRALTPYDKSLGAWLWSKRRGIITGVAASGLHGAEWVDATTPVTRTFAAGIPFREKLFRHRDVEALDDRLDIGCLLRGLLRVARHGELDQVPLVGGRRSGRDDDAVVAVHAGAV